MPTAEINGTSINYTDSGGDGPVLLFSHGFLMNHTMFDSQVEYLSGDYRCVTWDERGFGETAPNGDFTYWDSAEDAIGLLDHLGIDQAVLIGMSQGGYLGLRAVLAHPDRVRAMVLIDSSAAMDDLEVIAGYQEMVAGLGSGDDPTISAILEIISGLILGSEELAAAWIPIWKDNLKKFDIAFSGKTLLERDDIGGRMSEITCPLLQFHGSEDHAIEMDLARQVADAVADCREFVVVDGASHAPNMTHPEVVNPKLKEFLDSL